MPCMVPHVEAPQKWKQFGQKVKKVVDYEGKDEGGHSKSLQVLKIVELLRLFLIAGHYSVYFRLLEMYSCKVANWPLLFLWYSL